MSLHEPDSFQPYSFLTTGGRHGGHGAGGGGGGSVGGSIDQLHFGSSGADGHAMGATTGSSFNNMDGKSPFAPRTPAPRTPGGSIAHETEHGEYLADKLEYLVPPTLNAVDRDTPINSRTVFMGHMRFETTPPEVRWLIRKLTGVTALKVEVRAKGCFLVHLGSEQEENQVRAIHRRILMDHHGVWIARTPQEAAVLSDYVEQVLCRGPKRRLRLPKDCVTVETPREQQSAANGSGGSHNPPPPPFSHTAAIVNAASSPGSPPSSSSGGHHHYGGGGAMPPPPPPPAYGYSQQLQQPLTAVAAPIPSVVVGGGGGPVSVPYHHHSQQQQQHGGQQAPSGPRAAYGSYGGGEYHADINPPAINFHPMPHYQSQGPFAHHNPSHHHHHHHHHHHPQPVLFHHPHMPTTTGGGGGGGQQHLYSAAPAQRVGSGPGSPTNAMPPPYPGTY